MKRKDWRIKKLKKDIFDSDYFNKKNKKINLKRRRNKYLTKNIYFLRKLFLRKNRVLFKKNFIMNFLFYRKLKNSFFSSFNNYTNKFLFKSLPYSSAVFPLFFITKKIFFNHTIFNSFIKNNNLNYFFIKNYNNFLNQNNLKIIVFEKEMKKLNNDNLMLVLGKEKNNENFFYIQKSINEKNNFLISIEELNYFFNYNIFLLNSIEIYKILVLLHVNKLINKNK